MALPPKTLDDHPAMQDLARMVASGDCVWFIGSGLSYDAGLPSASALAHTMMQRALVADDSPWPSDQRPQLWERLKRLLIHPHYEKCSPFIQQTTVDGIGEELERVKAALEEDKRNIPVWADRLTHLGRVAEVLQRALPAPDQASIQVARLMGFEPGPPDAPSEWDKEPRLAHFLLALLIAEGCVSTVFTTNYDELLEQACDAVPVALRVVVSRDDLGRPAVERTGATYYKIHGCRGKYRSARDDKELRDATAALVVTDRQLQDWRGDNWARDLVNTHLRDRHFLFIGYSAYDAVLQETLNLIAEEIRGGQNVRVFVAPELSFPFYQYSAIRDGTYDPLDPPNLVPAYGEPLLRTVYPKALGEYFRKIQEEFEPPDYPTARLHWRCTSPQALEGGWTVAGRLLSEWAESVATQLVNRLHDRASVTESRERFTKSPFDLTRLSQTGGEGYRPLRQDRDEYKRLLRLLCRMLAVAFPDPAVQVNIRGYMRDLEEPTFEIFADHKLTNLVMISGGEGGDPAARVLQRLEQYFNGRSKQGGTGTFAILSTIDLDDNAAARITSEVKRYYGDGYRIELWHLSGVHVSEGGGPTV